MRELNTIINAITDLRMSDIIDIAIIAFIIYKIILLFKETRAEQVLKGLLLILIFSKVSEWLNLYTLKWLTDRFLQAGLIFIIVVFQPELRRALEKIGRGKINFLDNYIESETENTVNEIVAACSSLSRQKIGALIVLERNVGLSDIAESGVFIDGEVTSELLINIFIPNTPLHDGAVIIKDNKIEVAASYLPLTANNTLSKELGTRHRAALGITEKSDAFVVIVSEETGTISCAESGKISRYFDEQTLKERIIKAYEQKDISFMSKLRREDGTVEKRSEN
ncbi:MAG: diadenylate cyclase CdaA [Peptoniphilaceae bacterium]|nr:diadenylate cyclase CdaA [Peptoniphilaceae bacterium]MDD7383949.1 diadenylate cyclase CdaA [Peptoniphilaceae bacterium]MDY3738092.1 diadenylate cyclase CdaA [Peptoniphilaceae bacterium]